MCQSQSQILKYAIDVDEKGMKADLDVKSIGSLEYLDTAYWKQSEYIVYAPFNDLKSAAHTVMKVLHGMLVLEAMAERKSPHEEIVVATAEVTVLLFDASRCFIIVVYVSSWNLT